MLYKSVEAERDELETAEAAHALGIHAISYTPEQLLALDPGLQMSVSGGIHYPGDAHITPQLFMQQMMKHLKASGVDFLKQTEVVGIVDSYPDGCSLKLKGGERIQCKQLVVATGSWSGKLMGVSGMSLPMQDGKGYSMTLTSPKIKPSIPSILHEARVAITPMGDDLRISGTLEISGMDDQIYQHKVNSILDAVPAYYPDITIDQAGPVWYGYRPCSPDGLPYIGRWKPDSNVILATGHAMMGLSLAPVTGRIVKDLMQSGQHVLEKLNPSRFTKR